VPLALDESIGSWIALHEQEQCSIGKINAMLGNDTLLGDRSWRPDLRARIRIGPLDRQAFDNLLPCGAGARALERLLCLFGNPTISYDVRLILKAAEVKPMCLAGGATPPARLGQDSFLVAATETRDRGDMFYRMTPLAPLPPLAARAAASSEQSRNPS